MKLQIRLLFIVMLTNFIGYCQLSTSLDLSSNDLVENVLTGNGITVFNVQYTGSDTAIGTFNGAMTNVGIDTGVIMTTGHILENFGGIWGDDGPHGPNDSNSAGNDNGFPGNSFLTSFIGDSTYNSAILEFDFIPHGDSIELTLVFGSEEYNEFIGGGTNDFVGVFLTGPGIPVEENIAELPLGGGIIAIDNINNGSLNAGPCQNCTYFIDNGTGSTSPYDTSNYYIQYDGFTIPIQLKKSVICGETYHLKITITDVLDTHYDSGVFLSANSFNSDFTQYCSFQQAGDDLPSQINIDTNNLSVDSLLSSYYLVNNSTSGLDFNLIRNRIYHEIGWNDAVKIDGIYYTIPDTSYWESPSIYIAPSDSVLIECSLYPADIGGCSIYEYMVEAGCGWEKVNISYSVGTAPCYLESNSLEKEDNKFSIFPNPANDYVVISPKNLNHYVVKLYSLHGELLFVSEELTGETLIDTYDYNSGMYLVVITNDKNRQQIEKLFIE